MLKNFMIYPPNPFFNNRYINPSFLHDYICKNQKGQVKELGKSTNGFPIVLLTFGNKNGINILMWSQMHGNESNATLAMLDVLHNCNEKKFLYDEIFANISLDFIFMLNPDGSKEWTRRNALGIDLNRDFHNQASAELRLLLHQFQSKSYDFALNLHEQRTIFSTDGHHPATLSFLAPSAGPDRAVTETRKKAMWIIAQMKKDLDLVIPRRVGRYSDEFYPNAVGDNFTAVGIPTILFEGGHSPEDYYRRETRAAYALALESCLRHIGRFDGSTAGYEDYFTIPENQASHVDVIYRNVMLPGAQAAVDIAIQYQEIKKPEQEDISFIPFITEIGACGPLKGWKEVDCSNKILKSGTIFPKINEVAQFEFVD